MKTKEIRKPKIALFRSLINVAFGGLAKWKVLANPKEIVIAKEYNLISMFINPKTQMFSLKFNANKDIMGIDPKNVDAIILGKDRLTIIGDFNVKAGEEKKLYATRGAMNGQQKTNKKDNITI